MADDVESAIEMQVQSSAETGLAKGKTHDEMNPIEAKSQIFVTLSRLWSGGPTAKLAN